MNNIYNESIIKKIFLFIPMALLFFSVLNEFDVNYIGVSFFSFNFSFILIFFCTLRKVKYFGYGLVFISGLINDAVNGFPLGISRYYAKKHKR